MDLNFTAPKVVSTNCGDRHLKWAYPNNEFWREWSGNRQELIDMGIFIIKDRDENWRVHWLTAIQPGDLPFKVPPYMLRDRSKLFEYQPPAVSGIIASMMAHNKAIDASETGVGKTYVACAVARELGLRPCIVCLKTGISIWKRVTKYMGLTPVFIVNWEYTKSKLFPYGTMKENEYTGRKYYQWNLIGDKNFLIFDEIHRGNGYQTGFQDMLMAAKKYPLLGLSATLGERPVALRAVGHLLGLFTWDDFPQWLRDNGCFRNKFKNWEALDNVKSMERIGKMLFPRFGVRIRKDEVPGFPDVQTSADCYQIGKAVQQNVEYEKLVTEIVRLKVEKKKNEAMVLELRYRQLSEMYKIDLLCDLVKEYREKHFSVVVFVNYTDTLVQLCKKLKTNCNVYGKQKDADRVLNLRYFQSNKERKIICNINAGGQSIDLHDLHGGHPRVALLCPTYSAKALVQALGRIHRAGAKSKALNRLVYADKTVEGKVCTQVSGKIDAILALNDRDLADKNLFNLTEGLTHGTGS